MATETHIAGMQLVIKDRYMVQRCGWCGASMIAMDLSMIAMPPEPDGSPPRMPGMFEPGALVRVTYAGTVAHWGSASLSMTAKEVIEDDGTLPEDCCTKHIPFEDGRE